jgi:hypothetical protein
MVTLVLLAAVGFEDIQVVLCCCQGSGYLGTFTIFVPKTEFRMNMMVAVD